MFSTAVAPFFCSHQQVMQVLILPVSTNTCYFMPFDCDRPIILIGAKCYLIVVLFGLLKLLLMKAVVFCYTRKQAKYLQPKADMSNSITLKLTSMLYHIPPY